MFLSNRNHVTQYLRLKNNTNSTILDSLRHADNTKYTTSLFRSLRLGTPPLNLYLYKIDKSNSPQCPRCKFPIETIKHYLLQCNSYSKIRKVLIDKYRKIFPNLQYIRVENILLSDKTITNLNKKEIIYLYKATTNFIGLTRRFFIKLYQ